MRMAPSTPNAGSSLVSRWRGSGGADEVALGAVVEVGVGTMVTLKVTGITVATGRRVEPFLMSVVSVDEAVVRESEAESEDDRAVELDEDAEDGPEVVEDCAAAHATRAVRRSAVAAHDEGSVGRIGDGGDGGGRERTGRERPGLYSGVH